MRCVVRGGPKSRRTLVQAQGAKRVQRAKAHLRCDGLDRGKKGTRGTVQSRAASIGGLKENLEPARARHRSGAAKRDEGTKAPRGTAPERPSSRQGAHASSDARWSALKAGCPYKWATVSAAAPCTEAAARSAAVRHEEATERIKHTRRQRQPDSGKPATRIWRPGARATKNITSDKVAVPSPQRG